VDLLGTPFLLLSVLLALAAPVGAFLLWGRVRGADALRVAQRLGLLVLCQLTAVLLASVALNHEFAFYESWSDLFGQDDGSGIVQPDGSASGHAAGPSGSKSVELPPVPGLPRIDGTQRITRETVTGPRSGVRAEVTIVTPPGYAQDGSRRYPVVVFLPGYPGTPSTWIKKLGLVDVMDAEMAAGHVRPFVAVLPKMNIDGTRDLECSDVVNGPAAGTWLGEDVPRIVESQVRALPAGGDWGITGYSTGGFCSAKLALQYPHTYGAGAVLSGYFSPSSDTNLFGSNRALLHRNDPMWMITNGQAPPIRLLAVYSVQDPETAQPTEAFLAAAARVPALRVAKIRLIQGGHNTGVWQAVLPKVLAWLSPPPGSAP
jgi:enterochelin esterase-like enzyme